VEQNLVGRKWGTWGQKVNGGDGRKEAQKRAKNEGGLFERRTGAETLILHRRDWNAAEIDSEKE
jgi:hypothetical protein